MKMIQLSFLDPYRPPEPAVKTTGEYELFWRVQCSVCDWQKDFPAVYAALIRYDEHFVACHSWWFE